MTSGLEDLLRFAQFTLRNPRSAARELLDMNLSGTAAWSSLALACVLSSLVFHLSAGLLASNEEVDIASFFGGPLGTLAVTGTAQLILVFAVHLFGRAYGGKGHLTGAVVLIAWLQGMFLFLQLLQVLFLMVMPAVADVIGTLGMFLFLWLLAPFVLELHGFSSVWKVAFGIIGTAFVMAFAIALLIALFAGL